MEQTNTAQHTGENSKEEMFKVMKCMNDINGDVTSIVSP